MKVNWDDDIPNIWKGKNDPNHQPDDLWWKFEVFDGFHMFFMKS